VPNSGLGESFEEACGESMGEYLNGCNGVRDKHGNSNEEEIHCYLALLTAVEANLVKP